MCPFHRLYVKVGQIFMKVPELFLMARRGDFSGCKKTSSCVKINKKITSCQPMSTWHLFLWGFFHQNAQLKASPT